MDYEKDGIIQLIFEKEFDQLTLESNQLLMTPFDRIKAKTFDNVALHLLINKLTNRPLEKITEYLTNKFFLEKFLFGKIKKKLHVAIILDDIGRVKYLINYGYQIDYQCLQLAVLNNSLEILKYMVKHINVSKSNGIGPNIRLTNELLIYCSEFGHEEMYFYLRSKDLVPNISIFNKAVLGNSLNIIKDINNDIAISNKILTSVFQTNNTDIILFLVSEAMNDNVNINKNLFTYPILNNNFVLLDKLDELHLINWHVELYYSAILSGSMEMVKHLETKIPLVHENRILDTSKCKKGQITLLLEDMIYEISGKKYFSHTMNYAVQSGSLEMVKYIHQKKYGITTSNFITAIKQSSCEILKYLCQNYSKQLPFYLIHYFGTNCPVIEKIAKAKILLDSGLINTYPPKLSIEDFRKETAHIELISQSVQIPEDIGIIDIDYLMKYQIFFVPVKGYKLNYRLITRTRLFLELDRDTELQNIFSADHNNIDQQFIIDTLFLFGSIEQIKKFHPLSGMICPSQQIIMEILCYCQLNKLCYLLFNKLFTTRTITTIYPVAMILSDKYLNLFFEKIKKYYPELDNLQPDIKFILLSGNKNIINQYFIKYGNQQDLSKDILKSVLILDDIELLKKIIIPIKLLPELIIWSEESDLLEIGKYLLTINETQMQ